MNFATLKGLTIPECKVTKAWITIDGAKHLVFSANVAPEIIGSLITSEVCVYEDEYYESVGEDIVYDDWGIGYFYLAPPDKYDAAKGCWSADDVVEYCVSHVSGYNRYDTPTWPLDDVPDISQYAGWYMTDDIRNLTTNYDCELYVIAGNSKLRDDDWTKEDPADIQGGFEVYLSNYYKAQKKKV